MSAKSSLVAKNSHIKYNRRKKKIQKETKNEENFGASVQFSTSSEPKRSETKRYEKLRIRKHQGRYKGDGAREEAMARRGETEPAPQCWAIGIGPSPGVASVCVAVSMSVHECACVLCAAKFSTGTSKNS